MDISKLLKLKARKLKLSQQIKLIQLMNSLFASGFHLGEVVDFLARSKLTDEKFVKIMRESLQAGRGLADILEDLKFSKQVITQIALADYHGNIEQTLLLVEANLRKLEKVRKKLFQVASYPIMLLGFLILIMLGLKNYLLPQIAQNGQQSNFATLLINNLPVVFLGLMTTIGILSASIYFLSRRRSALSNMISLVKLPFLRRFTQDYMTAYFAREWGILIAQGIDFKKVLHIMSSAQSRIFSEVGEKLQLSMQAGSSFPSEIRKLKIFTPELALIVEYGEMKAKLGAELMLYSDECWDRFFNHIDRAMSWIQPLIFLFVALMIVLIYAAMLLPIYSNININM